jgi:hypothetical protein
LPLNPSPVPDLSLLTRLEQAGQWFLHSGIQEPSGGVARYYRVDQQRNLPVSTEITGYAISALLELYQRTKQSEYLTAARRAGQFLADAWNPEWRTMPFEKESSLAYFFDLGIIARGLLRLWRVTGEEWAREVAVKCGRSMLEDFPAERGSHCILELPEKKALPVEPWWSRTPGAFHLKAALVWHELGGTEFEEAYERQLAFSLTTWRDLLSAETQRERLMDRLHPLGYFLEGLSPVLQRPECAQAAREAIATGARLLREIGPNFTRSDSFAQLLRARLFAEAAGIMPLQIKEAREEYETMAGCQDQSDDPRRRGGYAFGTRNGEPLPFANPVSTAFCLQASAYWYERKVGAFQAHWRELI